MSEQTLLEAREIGRRAEDGRWLLREVSLSVAAGERWGIAGPTGSGKTLLLRTLALLDAVQEGSIRWQGREIEDSSVPAFRRRVIYLHQRPVLVEGTVEANLQLPFQLRGSARVADKDRRSASPFAKEISRGGGSDRISATAPLWSPFARGTGGTGLNREFVVQLLASLGRDESFLAKSSADLSGGEAQIVALLRALQLKPTVMLLDEPTAALDAESRTAIEMLVDRWFTEREDASALAWVSHDLGQLDRVTDKMLRLEHGRVRD